MCVREPPSILVARCTARSTASRDRIRWVTERNAGSAERCETSLRSESLRRLLPAELSFEPVRLDAIQPLNSLSADEIGLLNELLGGQTDLRPDDLVVYEVRERPTGKLRKIVAPRADDLATGILVTPHGFHLSRTRFGTASEISISLAPRLVVTNRDL